MHDPLSQICRIRIPIPFMEKSRRNYRGGWIELAEIWHMDPCKDGTDDSCGSFMRARHGDPDTLERIIKRLEQDWDNTYTSDFSGDTYNRGYFDAVNGSPVLSPSAIMLNIFLMAAGEHYDKGRRQWDRSWRKARAYIRRHLFDILLFAENPTDLALDSIRQTFVSSEDMINDGGRRAKERRDQRIRQMASMVYGCILRDTRPWWKSRNLHVHHWRITLPWWRNLKRLLWTRCCQCRRTLGWNKSVSPALERLIAGIELRRAEAISVINKGGHEDLILGFWDGYRHACEDLLKWARDCQANV